MFFKPFLTHHVRASFLSDFSSALAFSFSLGLQNLLPPLPLPFPFLFPFPFILLVCLPWNLLLPWEFSAMKDPENAF